MSTPTSTGTTARVEDARPRGSRWVWVLPALTFLAGLALGALVIGGPDDRPASGPADAAGAPGPGPSASPSDLLVRVPEPCLAVAEQAEEAVAVVDRAVDAVRSFDPRELQQVLDRAQELRPGVEQLAADCRARAGRDVARGDTVSATPTPGADSASRTTSAPTAAPTRTPTPTATSTRTAAPPRTTSPAEGGSSPGAPAGAGR